MPQVVLKVSNRNRPALARLSVTCLEEIIEKYWMMKKHKFNWKTWLSINCSVQKRVRQYQLLWMLEQMLACFCYDWHCRCLFFDNKQVKKVLNLCLFTVIKKWSSWKKIYEWETVGPYLHKSTTKNTSNSIPIIGVWMYWIT